MSAKIMEMRAAQYELEIEIDAPPERVWEALTAETNAWWLPDFHMAGEGSVVTLELEAGGALREDHPDGGSLLWYTVQSVVPGESIHLCGHTAPEWGGPATGMLRLAVEEREGGSALLVTDAMIGHVGDEQIESLRSGWIRLFSDGLKRHAEAPRS